jgi:NAD(P)H-flavin reductase
MLQYKVVELSNVSEDTIEEALNEWTPKGWRFDALQFAMRESSRRPAMAFVIFTCEVA